MAAGDNEYVTDSNYLRQVCQLVTENFVPYLEFVMVFCFLLAPGRAGVDMLSQNLEIILILGLKQVVGLGECTQWNWLQTRG